LNYFDAEEDKISPPLATSERKKVTKHKKKVKVNSDSGSDDLNMSSVSSGTINSNCSPEQLKKKAEKRIIKVRKALKMTLKEEALKTLKYDTKMIKSKINMYGDADDDDLNFLEEKLEDLIMKIDAQIEERRVVDRKLRQLPRGRIMVWDTGVESYNDFKRQMQDMLIYDSDSLRLSTLKDQIRGKDKGFIAYPA
jgi:hypothetical protein